MNLTTHQAYLEAAKFDDNLNKALELNPPCKENARFWLCYLRTIRSSCEIVEADLLEKLRKFKV